MLEDYILKVILIAGVILSGLCIVGNIIIGLPLSLNIKWTILILMCILALILIRRNSIQEKVKFIFFLLIIVFFIPFGWIDSGGSANNTIAYVFIILISIIYLFDSWKRSFLVFIHISMFTGLHILEYLRPDLMKVHPSQSQFLDRLLQIPLTLYASYLLIKKFAVAYKREKRKLDEYSRKLEEANCKLRVYATYDELTGVYNRRIFDENLNILIDNNQDGDIEKAYMALIDIDYFKEINDTYGHLVGDQILKSFGKMASEAIKSPNILARWGGDEFALLYYGDIDAVMGKLELFQSYIDVEKVGKLADIKATLSIGITDLRNNDTVQDVLKRVDEALYKAKANGRNKITKDIIGKKEFFY